MESSLLPLLMSRADLYLLFRHWRHISSFHGSWLQMPVEILETIANINYNTPRPRPLDPAVMFDLARIRRSVDEATDLAVRAASDSASPTFSHVNGGMPGALSMNVVGLGMPGHGAKLSRERRLRMRELACQKLADAYCLDEIASSVATMQSASALEDVGALVLQRNPTDADAKYVHFFHEKIPSRQLAESTSLQPLLDILSARAGQPEVFRTMSNVKVFKDDLEGAVHDLTEALSMSRLRRVSHRSSQPQGQPLRSKRDGRRLQDTRLSENEQPSGLDAQLLFQRGCVYMTMACRHILDGIQTSPSAQAPRQGDSAGDSHEDSQMGKAQDSAPASSGDPSSARRMVKTLAKRAIKDFLNYIAHLDYAPRLPVALNKEYNEKVLLATQGVRNPRYPDANVPLESHVVFPLCDLFSSVAPSDLPPFPSPEAVGSETAADEPPDVCEWLTYHPLLTESLHLLLLCHCLAQTSVKELRRHAYMVARLVRLCDGYPIFQASRSPARTDWVEVIRRTGNWLDLCLSWEKLCYPAPLPSYESTASTTAAAPKPGKSEALPSDASHPATRSVCDDGDDSSCKSLCKPLSSPLEQTQADGTLSTNSKHSPGLEAPPSKTSREPDGQAPASDAAPPATKPAPTPTPGCHSDAGKEHAVVTDRAVAIARWLLEAPPVVSAAKRKRRLKGPRPATDSAAELDQTSARLDSLQMGSDP